MVVDAPGWRDRVDSSVDGVFESFLAFAYAFPLGIGLFILTWNTSTAMPEFAGAPLLKLGVAGFIAIELIIMFAKWIGSLALLVGFTRAFDVSERAGLVIVAYNWSQLLRLAVQIAAMVVLSISASSIAGSFAVLMALAIQFAILWAVIRRGFDRNLAASVGVLILVVILTLAITGLITVFADIAFNLTPDPSDSPL